MVNTDATQATTRILVAYYSTYGHVFQMAQAVAEGARSVQGTEVRLCRIPELEEAKRALSQQEAYGQNPQILVTDGIGGSPYGPGTLAGPDGSRQPVEAELQTARNLGSRAARVAALTKSLR